jgi:hypothetical protein
MDGFKGFSSRDGYHIMAGKVDEVIKRRVAVSSFKTATRRNVARRCNHLRNDKTGSQLFT